MRKSATRQARRGKTADFPLAKRPPIRLRWVVNATVFTLAAAGSALRGQVPDRGDTTVDDPFTDVHVSIEQVVQTDTRDEKAFTLSASAARFVATRIGFAPESTDVGARAGADGTGSLDAQEATRTDHTVVIELGGAAEWPLRGERPNYGGALAAETTPIEHWLEIEAGAAILGTNRPREIAADFIVKKPFEISSTVEFMAGVGPELSWRLSRGSSARSVAMECALDLMVWPSKNVGWYLEPAYDLTSFRAASGRSLALTAGLIVGLPLLR